MRRCNSIKKKKLHKKIKSSSTWTAHVKPPNLDWTKVNRPQHKSSFLTMAYDIILQQSTLILSTDWHRRDFAVAKLLRIGSGLRTWRTPRRKCDATRWFQWHVFRAEKQDNYLVLIRPSSSLELCVSSVFCSIVKGWVKYQSPVIINDWSVSISRLPLCNLDLCQWYWSYCRDS